MCSVDKGEDCQVAGVLYYYVNIPRDIHAALFPPSKPSWLVIVIVNFVLTTSAFNFDTYRDPESISQARLYLPSTPRHLHPYHILTHFTANERVSVLWSNPLFSTRSDVPESGESTADRQPRHTPLRPLAHRHRCSFLLLVLDPGQGAAPRAGESDLADGLPLLSALVPRRAEPVTTPSRRLAAVWRLRQAPVLRTSWRATTMTFSRVFWEKLTS
jgi:hypothetical protein